jgi:hypothetical protein
LLSKPNACPPEIAARSDADLEAPAGYQVGHHGVLGNTQRQFERQGDDPCSQTDARGPRRGLRQENEGRRQAALAFVEMMLRDPGRIEAETLGMRDLGGGQAIALGGVGLVEQTGEEAEPLQRWSGRHWLNLVWR